MARFNTNFEIGITDYHFFPEKTANGNTQIICVLKRAIPSVKSGTLIHVLQTTKMKIAKMDPRPYAKNAYSQPFHTSGW